MDIKLMFLIIVSIFVYTISSVLFYKRECNKYRRVNNFEIFGCLLGGFVIAFFTDMVLLLFIYAFFPTMCIVLFIGLPIVIIWLLKYMENKENRN